MTPNRVGGTSPADPDKGPHRAQEQHRRIEKVEKVKAIEEAENERARKKFKSFMEEEDKGEIAPRSPSPLEAEFYSTKEPSLEGSFLSASPLGDIENSIVSNPSYSSPPDAANIPSNDEEEEESPLPKSRSFWSHVDAPPDQPLQAPRYKETRDSASRAKESPSPEEKKHKKEKPDPFYQKESIFGPPGKTASPKEKEKALAKEKELAKKKKAAPAAIPGGAAPLPFKEEKKEDAKSPHLGNKEEKKAVFAPPRSQKDLHAIAQREAELEKRGKEEHRKPKTIAIEAPSLTTLPNHIIPIAQSATVAATPYISPETVPLFYQMVGTIYVANATPGITKTEIVLNSPSFANSKFFGSTISIEKYATAPDSLNIRLTGTNEAVHTFNQNIPNLYAAFQNGNFNFRIGRITAEYSTEKPIFRRKEAGEGRSDTGGGLQDERGQR